MKRDDFSNEIVIAASQLTKEREYWQKKLAGDLVKSCFAKDYKKTIIHQTNFDSLPFKISQEIYSPLMRLSGGVDPLLFVILSAGLAILLHKHTENQDIIFGIPINRQEVEGDFINTVLTLRNRVEPELTFKQVLLQVKQTIIEALENQNYPIETLLNQLNMTFSGEDNDFPLFDVVILLENIHEKKYIMPVRPNIILAFSRNETGMEGILEFNSSLYEKSSMQCINDHYLQLMTIVLDNTDVKVADVDLLSEQERQELVFDFNATESEYPQNNTLHRLIEQQAEKTPDRTAVIDSGVGITYRELNTRASRIARLLRQKGVQPDTIVAIMMERCQAMIAALLGVLKAGGAYLPIESDYPPERTAFMLADCNASILLSNLNGEKELSELVRGIEPVFINKELETVTLTEPATTPPIPLTPLNLAYIIYTSGSTGKPKGVMIDHRSVVNYVFWAAKNYLKDEDADFPFFTPLSFDLTVTSIFTPLITGNAVVVYGDEDKPLLLEKIVTENNVGVVKLTPSHLKLLVEIQQASKIKHTKIKGLIVGGEELETSLTKEIHQNFHGKIKIFNEYGPTETTVGCMIHRYDPGKDNRRTVPIGKPADNTQIFILDKTKKPVPMGIVGEIYISGAGVARGYLNNPELTAERFCTPPNRSYKSYKSYISQKIYKTGDLARWIEGQKIEFLGRIDEQVKVRGYRIELEEIARNLTCHPAVKEAVVLAVENYSGSKRLVAYVVPHPETAAAVNHLLHLEKKGALAGHYVHETESNMPIISISQKESEFLYKEIFENQLYAKHGITLTEGACVFDVGAHIGMFSLFLNHLLKDVEIHAFEPIPPLYDILCLNMDLYGVKGKTYSCGLGSFSGKTSFTYYPNASVLSGRFPNTGEEIKMLKQYMRSQEGSVDSSDSPLSEEQMDDFLAERLTKKQFISTVNTLSQIIRDNNIEKIDLLKLAVEKSEMDVLKGIQQEDWQKIKQIVIEVTDTDGRLKQITNQLESQGYYVKVEQDRIFYQENNYHIYANRSQQKYTSPQKNNEKKNYKSGNGNRWYSPKQLKNELENHLTRGLPDYMIPSSWVLLDEFPLTTNGKLDKKVLPAPETINKEKYVPPRNKLEKRLIEIWTDVLGVNKQGIGIDSNFFELGGDSIKSIQVSSRLRKYNMHIDINHLFENPTIRELATHVKEKDRKIDQGPVTGNLPLTPIQEWFFHTFTENYHCNQAIMIHSKPGFNVEIVKKVFQEIAKHHDALRMVFEFNKDEVIQINRGLEGQFIDFEILDLESYSRSEVEKRIEIEANRVQRAIDISTGPLVKLALFRTNEGDHLLIVIHHLVVDGVSWRILIEDFAAGYQQAASGLDIKFQDKTDSFRNWALKLIEYAQNNEPLKELSYWKNVELAETPVLPKDYDDDQDGPRIKEGQYRDIVSVSLSQQDTNTLLTEANQAYNTQANDLLLTALGLTIKEWAGLNSILLNLEGHGREEIIEDIDITRTIGWFTSQFPIILEIGPPDDLAYCIKTVKETLRKIRHNGIGYGILKYLVPDEKKQGLGFKKEPEIGFNYLGQVGQEFGPGQETKNNRITISKMKMGDAISPDNMMNRSFFIDAYVMEGILEVVFHYDQSKYKEDTIEKLARGFTKNLLTLIQHCLGKEEKEFTPSDIAEDVELSLEEFEDIKEFTQLHVE